MRKNLLAPLTLPAVLRLVIALCIVTGLPMLPASGQQQRGEARNTQSTKVQPLYGRMHALIVGIDNYPNIAQLRYAVADADAMRTMLLSYGFRNEDITLLKNERADLGSVRQALAHFVDAEVVKPEDGVLFVFCGHGATVLRSEDDEMGYLLPYNAKVDLKNSKNEGPYRETCLSMKEVWDNLDISPAKHVLVIADACYSGLMASSTRAISKQEIEADLQAKVREVITAGGAGETAGESETDKHGYLSAALLEELRLRLGGGGAFKARDMADAARSRVLDATNTQHVQCRVRSGEGEFIFAPGGLLPMRPPEERRLKGEGPKVFAAGPATAVVVAGRGRLAGQKLYNDSWALVVGIGSYQNSEIPPLPSACNNARIIRDALVDKCGFSPDPGHTIVLTDAEATKSRIEAAVAQLCDPSLVHPGDRVFVYFSGRGQNLPVPNGGKVGYLIPFDANVKLSDLTNPSAFQSTCLDAEDIIKRLKACPANHRVFVVDAGFKGLEGPKATAALRAAPTNDAELRVDLSTRGLSVLNACADGERALAEGSPSGLGVFTQSLIEAVNTREETGGVFTIEDVALGARKSVVERTKAKQTPGFAQASGEGLMLFTAETNYVAERTADHDHGTVSYERRGDAGHSGRRDGGRDRQQLGHGAGSDRAPAHRDVELVYVPEGAFEMGSTKHGVNEPAPAPVRNVFLDPFWIGKNDVTVAQFRKYTEATGVRFDWEALKPKWGWRDSFPMVNVTWEEALGFCRWAGGDLPTEAQWEKAARGIDGRAYPWGNLFDRARLRCSGTKLGDAGSPGQVGAFPAGASPNGCLDMAGNVMQWCQDWYLKYVKDDLVNPKGAPNGKERVVRGGSWWSKDPGVFQTFYRISELPDKRSPYVGFRLCVGSPSGS